MGILEEQKTSRSYQESRLNSLLSSLQPSYYTDSAILTVLNNVLTKLTLKTAACGDPSSIKGGLPVAISTTVHPSDQISA